MKMYQKMIGALVIGFLLSLTGVGDVIGHTTGSKAEQAIEHRLILGTQVTNAPVYMGKQVRLEVSYGLQDGQEIIQPAKVRFYHDGIKIGQSRDDIVIATHPPDTETYGITMPREEGDYAIKTCVESGDTKKCSDATVDVRNLVKDKFAVSGPTVRQDRDDEGRGYIQASIRNNDSADHSVRVYLYYSKDDQLSRNDIRIFTKRYTLEKNGGTADIEKAQGSLQDGYYFLRVKSGHSFKVSSVRYVQPPTISALSIKLSKSSTTASRAELNLKVSNPRKGSITLDTWLAEAKVIDEPPYLVFRDLDYTSRMVDVAGGTTMDLHLVDDQAGNPDGIAGYIACVGKPFSNDVSDSSGNAVKCSNEVKVTWEN